MYILLESEKNVLFTSSLEEEEIWESEEGLIEVTGERNHEAGRMETAEVEGGNSRLEEESAWVQRVWEVEGTWALKFVSDGLLYSLVVKS